MVEQFLLYLAGYKQSIIDECEVDKHNAKIIGTVLFCVWIYATVAWFFFFQTVFEGWGIPAFMGFFMGFFILAFDRALIASLSETDKKKDETQKDKWNKFFDLFKKIKWGILFRFGLAVLLGIFLSQPMILKFYKPDIDREAKLLKEEKVKEYKYTLDSLYLREIRELQSDIKRENGNIETAFKNAQNAEQIFNDEQDTRGGTGIYGYGTVAKNKEQDKNRYLREYNTIKVASNVIIKNRENKIDSINNSIKLQVDSFKINTPISGTLIQAESLQSLIKKDKTNTLRFRYVLLALILTLIELSALISKFLFKTESYQSQVSSKKAIEVENSESNKRISLHSLNKFEVKLKESVTETINNFFNNIKPSNAEKIQKLIDEWRNTIDEQKSYKDVCQSFMDKFIIQGIGLNKDSNEVEIKQKKKAEAEEQYYKNLNRIIGNTFTFVIFSFIFANVILYLLVPYIPKEQLAYFYYVANLLSIIMSIYTFINNKKTVKR